MNSRQWLSYYQANKMNRLEPKWNVPSPLRLDMQQALALSLSHFQLGETGEGKFLIAQACRQIPDDLPYHEALRLFVAEEQEHARLLDRLVRRFGGRLIERHWTHSLFRLVRHFFGFKFEIQLLVIAELVGTAYYRLLQARTGDSVLEETCALLLSDEARHLQFHADYMGVFLSRLLPMEVSVLRSQFQILFVIATWVAWWDHRAVLLASGTNRREFSTEGRREGIRFLRQLQRNTAQQATEFAPVAVSMG